MSDDLKPCPFCGSNNVSTWNPGSSVVCHDCGTEGPMTVDHTLSHLSQKEAWDTRANDDRIEELEAKLAAAVEALRFYGSICADKDKSPWNVYSEDFGEKARALIAEINGGDNE